VDGGPLQFQEQHLFIPHASSAAEHGFDGRVDRFDDTEAHDMIAVCGDAELHRHIVEAIRAAYARPRAPESLYMRPRGRFLLDTDFPDLRR
jgi:hypothetical protein